MEAEVQRLIKRNYIKQIPPKQNIVSLAPHPFFCTRQDLGSPYLVLKGLEFPMQNWLAMNLRGSICLSRTGLQACTTMPKKLLLELTFAIVCETQWKAKQELTQKE